MTKPYAIFFLFHFSQVSERKKMICGPVNQNSERKRRELYIDLSHTSSYHEFFLFTIEYCLLIK